MKSNTLCYDREFEKKFGKCTSGNSDIDNFIQQMQRKVQYLKDVIEWIPFDKFTNIKYLANGGFGTVFKAIWTDGYIQYWDNNKGQWKRNPQINICLKSFNGSKERIKVEVLNEVENQHNYRDDSAIRIYGITKNPKDNNYMIVMQYAKQGSLRKLLDIKYKDLGWKHKLFNLRTIANGLSAIHKANLVHKDFHSGNIVNESLHRPFITDFGLCKSVSQDSSSTEIFGVLPYIAPEVLHTKGKEYTQKSDIYSFGIIMSELFTGYPPYHDIPHDEDLAIQVCLGVRPKIRCEVPQLLLDLMNKCLDAKPQNRSTAEELKNMFGKYIHDLRSHETELYEQIREIEAIYTSRSLNFHKLPEPVNADNTAMSRPIPDLGEDWDV
ncbi:kinase-like domain-containing protein [Gigaspora rosea]|uniref:Kinase-like domain-containing protein n=1 Tax=Gigaspora rosea TaxID=44941 RepID=A0A397UR12_9GLOM|nr:kinase-like domain-containing protein [Gigaspora rosea]